MNLPTEIFSDVIVVDAPEELGFAEDMLAPLTDQIRSPNGIVLFTRPTGSGASRRRSTWH